MFHFLKTMFSGGEPEKFEVEPVDFKDGLLRLKSDEPLPLKEQTVLSKTPTGVVETVLDIRSYDGRNQLYLAHVPEADESLEALGVSVDETTRVLSCLDVTGSTLPDLGGFTEDISVGGMRLRTGQLLEPGSLHDLTIRLDNKAGTKLRLKAKVSWSAHDASGTCHSGLRFRDVDAQVLRSLIRFIRARQS